MANPSYTVDGGPALDQLIAGQLAGIRDRLLAALPNDQLDCLVLGGGYGRGEGGVLLTPEGPRPYNDYDLDLIHHLADGARLAEVLREVQPHESARCGIHVDVNPTHRDRVARLPPALTWYELGVGHRLVWGDGTVLEPLRRRTLAGVHPTEWGRLLTNRACGLVFARWVLEGTPCPILGHEDPLAFSWRQVQKAWLSLGDVWLADRGAYRPSVRERRLAMQAMTEAKTLPWIDRWLAATGFKLRPSLDAERPVIIDAMAELAPLLAAALTGHRASPIRPLAGPLATVRHVPPAAWWSAPPWWYPRDRLRLACTAELRGDVAGRVRLTGDVTTFTRLWQRYG